MGEGPLDELIAARLRFLTRIEATRGELDPRLLMGLTRLAHTAVEKLHPKANFIRRGLLELHRVRSLPAIMVPWIERLSLDQR